MVQKTATGSALLPSAVEVFAPETWPAAAAARIWMEIGTEACDFLVERVQSDLETQQALLHCTSPSEAQVVLLRHGHKAIEDYHREAGRMMQLLHRVPGATALLES